MRFVCDAPGGGSWFQIETQAEADAEAQLMGHRVDRHFAAAEREARESYRPGQGIERDIGLKDHIRRTMPHFLTLRTGDGGAHVTAMLVLSKAQEGVFSAVIVGRRNSDPFELFEPEIEALGAHYGLTLNPERCYPYGR